MLCVFVFFGWRPSAKKTAQPHLTARLPQVAQKPPRQRHLAAQEKKNAAKTKAPERRSRTRDTSKPIARVSAGSCNFKPESRDENGKRQCIPKPKRRQNKQKATTQPSDTGPLGTRWWQAARKPRTTQCRSTQGRLDRGDGQLPGMGTFSLPQQAEATNGLPTRP